jgi:ketosteroid isomerase-like protein
VRMTEPQPAASRGLALTREEFTAALCTGDARGASQSYADEATLLAPPAEVIEGRAAIEAFWRVGMEAGMTQLQLAPLRLERRDGVAYELGRFRLHLEGEDGRVVDRGTYMVVHERQTDGSWLRVAEMFNVDGMPSPQPGGRTA